MAFRSGWTSRPDQPRRDRLRLHDDRGPDDFDLVAGRGDAAFGPGGERERHLGGTTISCPGGPNWAVQVHPSTPLFQLEQFLHRMVARPTDFNFRMDVLRDRVLIGEHGEAAAAQPGRTNH